MFCHICGVSLPAQSAFCPACGTKIDIKPQIDPGQDSASDENREGDALGWKPSPVLIVIGISLLLMVAVAIYSYSGNSQESVDGSGSGEAAASVTPHREERPSPADLSLPAAPETPFPQDEQEFIRAVQAARTAFQQAPNEMAQGGTRAQRREAICRVLAAPTISGWIGHISKLGSNSDGKGVLEISLADGLLIKTWNNDLSDISDNTLIDPSSPLFRALSQMKVGDEVSFSGLFLPSDVDCVQEASLTLSGSMTDPEFVFRFMDVIPRH